MTLARVAAGTTVADTVAPRTFNSMNDERGRDALPASVAFSALLQRLAHPSRSIKNRNAAVGVVAALRGADRRSRRRNTSADRHIDLALFRVRVFGPTLTVSA